MMKTKPWLLWVLATSMLLGACGANDRQARVDAASSQLVSERLGTATVVATVVATKTSAPVAVARPSATAMAAAPATVVPAPATPAAQATAAVPWAANLKRIPGSNDPDGFDYEAPPEVVEAIGALVAKDNAAWLEMDSPEKSKKYTEQRLFLTIFTGSAKEELDAQYAQREREGYAINVVRSIEIDSFRVTGLDRHGLRARAEWNVKKYVIDTYYPKSLKFYKSVSRDPFMVSVQLVYLPEGKQWLISHLAQPPAQP